MPRTVSRDIFRNPREPKPDSSCRQAWAQNSQAIFQAAVPEPGRSINAPSEIQRDPWGNPYVVLVEAGNAPPRIVSAGPDAILATPDDVSADVPYWPEPGAGRERQ